MRRDEWVGGRSSQGIISPREAFCVCLLAYFNGTADHAVMVAGGVVCVNKEPEVAVAFQWKRGGLPLSFVAELALCYDCVQKGNGRLE